MSYNVPNFCIAMTPSYNKMEIIHFVFDVILSTISMVTLLMVLHEMNEDYSITRYCQC